MRPRQFDHPFSAGDMTEESLASPMESFHLSTSQPDQGKHISTLEDESMNAGASATESVHPASATESSQQSAISYDCPHCTKSYQSVKQLSVRNSLLLISVIVYVKIATYR